MAEWDGESNQLVSNDAGFIIETGSGFIDDGGSLLHRLNWTYNWDSASLPAGLNTSIVFTVADGCGFNGFG